jgi:thiol-disulfide isomerase/thioredoxin
VRWTGAIVVMLAAGLARSAEKKIWADEFLGKPAPEIVVEEWLSEKPRMAGKWLLLDFWATWCGPCIEAIPHLNEFHRRFGDRMVVVGLSSQPRGQVERMRKPVIEYFHGIDPQSRSYRAFGVKGLPHVVIIDPQGVVRWEGYPLLPGFKLTPEVIEHLLRQPAGPPPVAP